MRTLQEFRDKLQRKHKELRRPSPSGFGFALFDSIQYVPEAYWTAVVPSGKLPMQRRYLRAIEACANGRYQCRYGLVFDGERPVAAAAFQIVEFKGSALGGAPETEEADAGHADQDHASPNAAARADTTPKAGAPSEFSARELRRKTQQLKQRLEDKLEAKLRDKVMSPLKAQLKSQAQRAGAHASLRLLVCGSAYLTGELGFHAVEDLEQERAFHALAELCYRLRRAERLSGSIDAVLIKDFYQDQPGGVNPLTAFGYKRFNVDPNMIVTLRPEWKSLDSYLGAMSAKYRARAKNVLKKAKAVERVAFSAEQIAENRARIDELYDNVHARAKFRIACADSAYLFQLKLHLGEDFAFITYQIDDKLVGFTTTIFCGDELEGHTIGIDYDYNRTHAIYQNILYDDIRIAIERGAKRVLYGRTALEMKSAVGAEPHAVHCYLRHVGSVQNQLLRPLFRYLKESAWTQRRPFKEA